MDLRHNCLLLLACLICLKPADVEPTTYCSGLGNLPAINVCQSSTATGNKIYLDSTGAAAGLCSCNLTHDSSNLIVVFEYKSLHTSSGITFEINKESGGVRYSKNVTSGGAFSSSPVVIGFTKDTDNDAYAACFGIKGLGTNETFTITCYPVEGLHITTPDTYPASTTTQIKAETTTLKQEPNSIQTTTTTRSQNETSTNIVANASTDNSGSNIGLIAGVAGGGGVALVMIVVVIIICKRQRTRREQERETTLQQQEDNAYTELSMTSRGNTYDQIDQGGTGTYTDLTVSSRENTNDQTDQGGTGTYTDLTVSPRGNTYDQINHGDSAYTDLTVSSRGNTYDQIDQIDMRSVGNARLQQDSDPAHQYSNINSTNPNYENPDF